MIKGHYGALLYGAELAQHVHQLFLQAGVLDRHLLDLDHEPDLAEGELDDLLQQGHVLAAAGVQPPQLGRRVIAYQSAAVGRPFESVVVDHHEAPVGGQVHIALDEVATSGDGRPEGSDRVLGMFGRVATMSAQQGQAVVMRGLVSSTDRLSQGAGKSNCAGGSFW